MKIILAFILAFIFFGGGLAFTYRGFENPYPHLCDLVAEKIFLSDEKINPWYRVCQQRAELVKRHSPSALIAQDMNNLLALLDVSHLEVHEARQVKEIWQGAFLETGIESKFTDGELVVTLVHQESPADQAGIVMGDVIVTINGEPSNQLDAKSQSGQYEILARDNSKKILTLETRQIRVNQFVKIKQISGVNYIKVPSFRAPFFDNGEIARIKIEINSQLPTVLDLRGNQGGNFVAGLRLLSLFLCEPTLVGELERSRSESRSASELIDQLDDLEQIKQLDAHRILHLKTYSSDMCLKKPVIVLIDGETASTAEMVAQALREYKDARIWGEPSRGQLLVGLWYPFDELSPGAQVVIPEALYKSAKGRVLEAQGVELHRILYYDLKTFRRGVEPWLEQALKEL